MHIVDSLVGNFNQFDQLLIHADLVWDWIDLRTFVQMILKMCQSSEVYCFICSGDTLSNAAETNQNKSDQRQGFRLTNVYFTQWLTYLTLYLYNFISSNDVTQDKQKISKICH